MKLALLGFIVFGFVCLLVYEDALTFKFKQRAIPINLSLFEDTDILTLDDIFISVKTSKYLAETRVPIILKTWFQLAKQQTWFITDEANFELQNQTEGHMIESNCSSGHIQDGLNCKMETEYIYYMRSGKKWFCHFDDDNYVNVYRLVHVLKEYSYKNDWYLGKRSSFSPVKMSGKFFNNTKLVVYDIEFWFGTGGAGFCISKTLALKLYKVVTQNGFKKMCSALTLPDDVCVGFVIDYVTRRNVTLTQVAGFHSHLEFMQKISVRNFRNQISFSYSEDNTIDIPGFDYVEDPTRFLSLHCFLFPYFDFCRIHQFQQLSVQ